LISSRSTSISEVDDSLFEDRGDGEWRGGVRDSPAFVMLHCRVHFAMVVAAAYSRIPKDTIDPNPEEGRLSHSRGLKVDAL